jgi:hypothetical protein
MRQRVLAGALVLFGVRLILSLVRTGPVLVADEIGYLTNARVLSGGLAGQLHMAPFYRGGYSLLLVPLLKLSSDPDLVYHLVLVLNAALAASVFPLLYLLLTRFGGVAPGIAIWGALAGAVYPALTVLSQAAMSENALFPLICLWLIACGGLLAARDPRSSMLWGAALGASAAALWAVHGRMVSAVVLTAVIVAWLGIRRRLPARAVVTALVVLGAGLLATHLLNGYLIDHNYGGAARSEAGDRLSAVFQGHGLLTSVANLFGQAWYLVVSTFGLVVVVFASLLERVRRGAAASRGRPLDLVAILAALTVLLLVVSATAFPVRTRPDMLIYGRYVEVVSPPLIAFGFTILAGRRLSPRMARPLLAFALLSAVVVFIRLTASDPNGANRWNIAGLPFVTSRLGPAILIGAAVVAAAGALLLARLSRGGPRLLGTAAVALFLPIVVYGAWNPVISSERAVYPAGWTSPQPIAAAHNIRSAAYDLDHYDTIGLYVVQWFLPDTSLRLFHGNRQRPPSRYVLSARSWPRQHPHPGASELWTFRGRDEALYRLGGF